MYETYSLYFIIFNYMEANKPLSVMRASLAGKQRTHAVKIYGSIRSITIVLSHRACAPRP